MSTPTTIKKTVQIVEPEQLRKASSDTVRESLLSNSDDKAPTAVVVDVPDGHETDDENIDSPTTPNTPENPKLYRAFSWNRDEDESLPRPEKQNRGCCGNCLAWYKRWPPLLRSILYSFTGVSVIMTPGLVSLIFYVENTNVYFTQMQAKNGQFAIGGYPFFVWAVYLSISWTSFFGLRWVFQVLPEIMARVADMFLGTTTEITGASGSLKAGRAVAHYLDYVRFLKSYAAFFLWTIINFVSWSAIFNRDSQNGSMEKVIQQIWLCFLFGSLVWLIEKFFLQVFAVQFHKRAYQDRSKVNKMAFEALACLNKARKRRGSKGTDMLSSATSSDLWDDSASSFFERKSNMVNLGKDIGNKAAEIGSKAASKAADVSKNIFTGISTLFGAAVGLELGASSGLVLRTSRDAKMFAKKLFIALTNGTVDYIVPSDFDPYFPTPEDSRKAFALFDKDENGDISKQEMKSAVLEIFREREALEVSLRSSSQAIEKLDNILKVIVFIIILFVSLSIFSVDTTKFMAAAISIWAGLLFAVGGTVKNLVESCIFLFLTHPYDVGDRVDIDDQSYLVKEFGLTSTVLKRVDGKEIYAPNIMLASKLVHNVRRSGNQSETISINVALNTTDIQIQSLRDYLLSFLMENGRDYQAKMEINIAQIVDKSTMQLSMVLEHKGNWQDGGKKAVRRNKFMHALKLGIEKFEIHLPNPLNA